MNPLKSNIKPVFFVVVGTIAEFIKIAPLVLELKQRGGCVIPIATGQNDIEKSDLYDLVFPEQVQYWITRRSIKQTPISFAIWALECFCKAFFLLPQVFKVKLKKPLGENVNIGKKVSKPILIVHGDTVSTFIGAFTGWCVGAEIIHVEAGLRSFDLLRPFPEELCRVFVSRFAGWSFCPGRWACGNLKYLEGKGRMHVIDTEENTLLDGMRLALKNAINPELDAKLPRHFFLFVCHRQENLLDKTFLREIIHRIEIKSKQIPCVTIIHHPAEVAFKNIGVLERLTNNSNIVALPRQSYFDFTNLLVRAEFVITDGGSNQEECYFLGKSCLVLRKESERREGLGGNALLSMKDFSVIDEFLLDPSRWKRAPVSTNVMPSLTIAKHLLDIQS